MPAPFVRVPYSYFLGVHLRACPSVETGTKLLQELYLTEVCGLTSPNNGLQAIRQQAVLRSQDKLVHTPCAHRLLQHVVRKPSAHATVASTRSHLCMPPQFWLALGRFFISEQKTPNELTCLASQAFYHNSSKPSAKDSR